MVQAYVNLLCSAIAPEDFTMYCCIGITMISAGKGSVRPVDRSIELVGAYCLSLGQLPPIVRRSCILK